MEHSLMFIYLDGESTDKDGSEVTDLVHFKKQQ